MSHTLAEQFYSKGEPQKLDTKESLTNATNPRTIHSPKKPQNPMALMDIPYTNFERKVDEFDGDATMMGNPTTPTKVETLLWRGDPDALNYQNILDEVQKNSKDLLEGIKPEKPVSISLGEPCYKEILKWYLKKKGSDNYVATLEQGVLELTVEKHLMLRDIRQLRRENELLRTSKEGHRLGEKRQLL
jgi:hypothetical protein